MRLWSKLESDCNKIKSWKTMNFVEIVDNQSLTATDSRTLRLGKQHRLKKNCNESYKWIWEVDSETNQIRTTFSWYITRHRSQGPETAPVGILSLSDQVALPNYIRSDSPLLHNVELLVKYILFVWKSDLLYGLVQNFEVFELNCALCWLNSPLGIALLEFHSNEPNLVFICSHLFSFVRK